MASTPTLLTARDIDILQALDRCRLTARQLLKLSATFAYPFTSERKVRDRMQILAESGRVNRWTYVAIAGRANPLYYGLTRHGHRLLYGADAVPPAKRAFAPIGIAHQQHSYALAEFVTHTLTSAHASGICMSGYCPENTVCLTAAGDSVYPDAAWQFTVAEDQEFSFFLELDNGTERVRSEKDIESWERKIRTYEAFQDKTAKRFRVLVVATRSKVRVEHILRTAAQLAKNPDRSLFYGTTLAAYLAERHAVTARCFRDHRGQAAALVPLHRSMLLPCAQSPISSQQSPAVIRFVSCS
jgi:hypothetical protein